MVRTLAPEQKTPAAHDNLGGSRYVCLSTHRTPDVASITLPSVRVFADVFGFREPADGLASHALGMADLERLAQRAIGLVTW